MLNNIDDNDYLSIVESIIKNNEFQKLDSIEHHGTSRFSHSLRVSYFSYKICKILRLDYISSARAGLLHDFFISDEDRTLKDRFLSTFTHPKKSVDTSKKYFEINEKEENIIRSHMFPIYTSLPKYAESWIVSSVDKIVGTYEFALTFKSKMSYATNLMIFVLLSSIK